MKQEKPITNCSIKYKERADVESQIAEFFESGGKVVKIPSGKQNHKTPKARNFSI